MSEEEDPRIVSSRNDRLDFIGRLAIWKDGRIASSSEAVISVWDHGFLYGDGVFEGLRLRSGRIYRFDDHARRLRRSAKMLKLSLAFSDDDLKRAIAEVARVNDLHDGHVRIVVSRGYGLPGLDPRNAIATTTLVMVYPLPQALGTDPISVITSYVVRKAPRSGDPAAKTLNYLDAILAKLQAVAAGADDAIMLDGEGFVAESTASNLFLVADGVLVTPTCSAALPGITRQTILELAPLADIPHEVRRVTVGELHAADEVFLTGSGAGIVPVHEVDGRTVLMAPGAVTLQLAESYRESWTDPRLSVATETILRT